MKLIIAEKPLLGKAIADALPGVGSTKDGVIQKGDYTIVWAYGYLLTLKEPEDFDEKYAEWSLEDLPLYFERWDMKMGKDTGKKRRIREKILFCKRCHCQRGLFFSLLVCALVGADCVIGNSVLNPGTVIGRIPMYIPRLACAA